MSVDDPSPAAAPSAPGGCRAYLQLLRLPNVFTAIADVAMGFLLSETTVKRTITAVGDDQYLLSTVSQVAAGRWPVFVALVAASVALYLAGMVLNDVFDVELDRRERPARPIPSGRIPLATASRLGFALLAGGVLAGWIAAALAQRPLPGIVATALAALVFAYNRTFKSTAAAPLAMGGCRVLNVLLGMSATLGPWHDYYWLVAGGIGVYIAGVTWFARTEAERSQRGALLAGTLTMIAGIGLVAWYPAWRARGPAPQLLVPDRWYLFWLMIGALVIGRCLRAVADPRPVIVQAAVKNCILGLIVIDAAAALATAGPTWAALILTLVLPATLLGRWIYST